MNFLKSPPRAAALVAVVLATALLVAGATAEQSFSTLAAGEGGAQNVILLIGDGMGPVQVEAARWEKAGHDPAAYATTTLAMDGLPYSATVGTASANAAVTDSAAAATALMTGTRTDNGVIGQDASAVYGVSDGARLTTIAELAKADGLATGAISTTHATHATPAGVYAHVNSREQTLPIAAQFLDSDLDLMLSGGYQYFSPSTKLDQFGWYGLRTDGRDLVAEARAEGYTVATTAAELAAVPAAPGTRVLGLFAGDYMAYESARAATTEPSLATMTREALDVLSTDPDGFFLMVEGGKIDTASHNRKYDLMTGEVLALDDAVATARAFADTHPGTLVIVTADHETGGLTSTRNTDGTLTFTYTSGSHSATDVPLRAAGPGADVFTGSRVLNTAVFDAMEAALGPGTVDPTPTPTTSPTPTPSADTASITFTSNPSGGQLYLDGVYRGLTPLTVDGVALGDHHFEIRLDGYVTYTKDITVDSTFVGRSIPCSYNPTLVPIGPPTAAFTATPLSGEAPLEVAFTDASTAASSWAWDFGDGATSSERNPVHAYGAPGTYTATLTAASTLGTSTASATVTVLPAAVPLDAVFSASPVSGAAPLPVQFTDASTGGAVAWRWEFGDRATSTDRNPSHTYAKAGTYTVKLTVTDDRGRTDTAVASKYVTVAKTGRR
jgi:alkaline phosphatase